MQQSLLDAGQQVLTGSTLHRYGGIYAIGMAYRGTANNAAIQKLLHFAVGDVSDDVRRAAVLALGFVLMNVPEQCPRIVSLLSESYNPHVRYGEPDCACCSLVLPAVLALGFMLLIEPEQCPRMVSLLSECYNPHVPLW